MGGLRQAKPQIEIPAVPGFSLRPPLKAAVESAESQALKKEEIQFEPFELKVFREVKSFLARSEVEAFEKLVMPYLKMKPAPKEFPYDDVAKDEESVKQKQETALKNDTLETKIAYIKAKIFEALLGAVMELHWFPSGTYLTETSDYDDWINGADAVLEVGPMKIVIDFTSQRGKEGIRTKVEGIYARIDRGELGGLKYFKSQTDKRKHALRMLPMVIIGFGPRALQELLDLYLAKNKKELENHWIKSAIVEEILAQAEVYKKYINNSSRRVYNPNTAHSLSRSYDDLERAISKIGAEKIPSEREGIPTGWKQDPVFQTLMAAIKDYGS